MNRGVQRLATSHDARDSKPLTGAHEPFVFTSASTVTRFRQHPFNFGTIVFLLPSKAGHLPHRLKMDMNRHGTWPAGCLETNFMP